MMRVKRIQSILLIFVLCFSVFMLCSCIPDSETDTEFETEVVAPTQYIEKWSISTSANEVVTAYVEDASTMYNLTIVGNGSMKNFTEGYNNDTGSEYAPWYSKYAKGIKSIAIGTGVTSIGEYAFFGCSSMTTCKMGKSVKTIGKKAFYQCEQLTSIKFPSTLTEVADNSFDECYCLSKFEVDNANTLYSTNDGVLYNKDKTILIRCPAGKKSANYTVLNTVVEIKAGAFANCKKMSKVSFADGIALTSIGKGCFSGCTNMEGIILPNGITTLNEDMFASCYGLKWIVVPQSVTTIQPNTFYKCFNLNNIYYSSTSADFALVTNQDNVVTSCIAKNGVYYYSATEIVGYWYFDVDGDPMIW